MMKLVCVFSNLLLFMPYQRYTKTYIAYAVKKKIMSQWTKKKWKVKKKKQNYSCFRWYFLEEVKLMQKKLNKTFLTTKVECFFGKKAKKTTLSRKAKLHSMLLRSSLTSCWYSCLEISPRSNFFRNSVLLCLILKTMPNQNQQ